MSTIEVTYYSSDDEGGYERTAHLPARWVVCSECDGHGTHVDRAIDGNGISAEEWAEWDQEDREGYLLGAYDVTCETCGGRTTQLVVDEEAAAREQPEAFAAWCAEIEGERQAAAEDRYLRRMEGGY